MFLHAYQRALAAIAALSSILALTLVVLVSSSATAAPGCRPGYPATVATTTSLSLRSVGFYGGRNVASVRVRSNAGRPGGTVTISGRGFRYTVTLHGGRASHALPRYLPARHTYRVTARYPGRGCFKASSASKSYTVYRAFTRIRGLTAAAGVRGRHPYVSGRVVTSNHATAIGTVSLRIYHHRHFVQSRTATLRHGRFSASFSRVYALGRWTAVAIRHSSANYSGSRASTSFRVRR